MNPYYDPPNIETQVQTDWENSQAFKETPVIMLSSKDGLFDRARGRLVGSEQYLTKPFTKDELLGAIRNHRSR